MELLKRTWADVSLDNLSHNYKVLRENVPAGCRFLGVVKRSEERRVGKEC